MKLSQFEQLPDEIILKVCCYLRPLEIINGFGRLNTRLDRTISKFRHYLDLHHLTLNQYRRWSTELLAYTSNDIIHLVLSNWNSPGQIRLFNQLIEPYQSVETLFPSLKQLRLIGFDNDDVDILPKLSSLENIFIDIDALKPLRRSTESSLDRYLFGSSFSFKEIRLWASEQGIRFSNESNVIVNASLENLTIVLNRFNDLFHIFQRTPNLRKLYVQINCFCSNRSTQYIAREILPKYLTDFHIQTKDRKALTFDDFFTLMIHLPSIQRLSVDIDTDDLDYADGLCWTFLKSRLPQLKQIYFKIRLWIGTGTSMIDPTPFLQSFLRTNLPVFCYADTKVLHIDTIPYDRHKLEVHTSVTTSPCARSGKATHHDLFHRSIYGIESLVLSGRFELTHLTDWFMVLRNFPMIHALDLTAVNILTMNHTEEELTMVESLRLPRLIALRLSRSRRCEINIPLFQILINNQRVTPNLRALTAMYGDLIYLCKRVGNSKFNRIEELWLLSSNTDGRIILDDICMFLAAFSSLSHFTFFLYSSRAINRHAEKIVETILLSMPRLVSFRLVCRQGTFHLPSLTSDIELRDAWMRRVMCINDSKQVHLTIRNNEFSIWK